MKEFVAITKALADESRIRALMALRKGELCACQIIALLKLAPSTVSKHMSILKQAGLVESRRKGTWIYYRLSKIDAMKTQQWMANALTGDATIADDDKRLLRIACADLEILCKKQKNGKR
jgi:ArsR family transcriptional regulator, arsenate/arsenite/antimonite-responsive transcriptional repressor